MTLFEILRAAVRALGRNMMRSFLTVLGIMIGVAAVIAMVAIGEGAKAQVAQSFAAMGANMLIVLSGATTAGGQRGGYGSMPTLTWGDMKAIQTELKTTVKDVAPVMRITTSAVAQDLNWTTSVGGTTPSFFRIRAWPARKGRLLDDSDELEGNKVAVLGQTVVDNLFGHATDPVGKQVAIQNIPFEVVGVLAPKGQSPTGQDYDDGVFIPETTFRAKIQAGLAQFIPGAIMLSAVSDEATTHAQAQITLLLRDRHHILKGADDDFSIRNLAEMAAAQQQGTKTITTLLASIAAVSLLVGGIGIMNIMLVSVTERTREIGLRIAVGATASDVLSQFLVEALALSTAGGIVGVAIGVGVAAQLSHRFGWPMLVQPAIVIIAVGFSGLVGVGFGLYPARKASQLDPIDALRFE